ncbi:ATP-NAD kinase [Thelephora terrestris]|uniref:ATP-NAD kinase n=1 Tax=Thelephora terrestris TaxID=56493 RepID=A0A9P6HRF2_9AGAM|nr:ATP-NAD kinase [Thelephora terrestris]
MASPDVETFSTPPTTPMLPEILIKPSLSRRNSRPSGLRISSNSTEWTSDIVLDPHASPEYGREPTPTTRTRRSNSSPIVNFGGEHRPADSRTQITSSHVPPPMEQPTRSPCFIHSHLNNSASLTDWLRAKRLQEAAGKKKLPHRLSLDDTVESDEEEEEYVGSLTAQLAETAVSVREMSKQLGRARVLSSIQHVLIVTKARDNRLIKLTRELALYLMRKPRQGGRGLVVYVDAQLQTSRRFDAAGIERDHPELFRPFPHRRSSSSATSSNGKEDNGDQNEQGQLRYWTAEMCGVTPHLFDFVVTLGGDGTVLFTSWLFQRIVPPVLPFALGSLGFLTNFDFAHHQAVVDSVVESGIRVNLRMRFTCTVYRAVKQEEGGNRKAIKRAETGELLMKGLGRSGWEAIECGWAQGAETLNGKEKQIMCFTTRPVESFEVLNDLVVDRGPSPYVSLLELFADDDHLTTVQADGLCISTPTGSTAYSLSAGGSLVHPEIPSMLITPLCPHTLSFRPMLLPDSMELRICVPFNSRSTAWASFDGRGRIELKQGDHITVTASKYPFPTVCADKQSTDWFSAISRTLNWNQRERQKSFVMVEESAKKKPSRRRSITPKKSEAVRKAAEDEEVDEEGEEDEEEDDKFDIDDLSGTDTETKAERISHQRIPKAERDWEQHNAEVAAEALSRGNIFPSRLALSKSGTESGVDSPSRFMGPPPRPPKMSARHVQWTNGGSTDLGSNGDSEPGSATLRPSHPQLRERPARNGVEPGDGARLPTLHGHSGRGTVVGDHRGRSGSKDSQDVGRRAFAVWGHDESDSNASDNDTSSS